MISAYLISAARTPTGAFLGGLSGMTAPELASHAIRAAVRRAGITPPDVDEVIMGNVLQAGVGQAPARQAMLLAGLPDTASAVTINMVCGSGLRAVMLADQAIRCGDASVVVAGGMESMSQAPFLTRGMRAGTKMGDSALIDAMLWDGLTCSTGRCVMGQHAEHVAERFAISRSDQDAFAALSQQRAEKAQTDGVFNEEIVPITVKSRKGETVIDRDECVRAGTTIEALAALRPVFRPDGTVTAGNSSALSDGAAACVVANEATSKKASWRFRIVASAVSGTAPEDLFIAPVEAVRKAVKRASLTLDDIDLFEINEAFASQAVACIRELGLDSDRVNLHGGGISLGHPIGASGARILVTLCHSLLRTEKSRGVASLCLGGGNAVALVIEAA